MIEALSLAQMFELCYEMLSMGKVIVPIRVENLEFPAHTLEVQAFVDTAAAYLTLPAAWRARLGRLRRFRTVKTQFADQRAGVADVYGPVLLKIGEFPEISTEVLFIDMSPDEQGNFEPLLGYIPLEQANAAVDLSERKLIALKYVDMK